MTFLLALLRVVSLLLPREVRAEWLREWSAECWHCWQEPGGWRAVEFCWGAIPDALWMRRNSLPSARVGWLPFPSPWDCGLFLAGMAGMAGCLVWAFPGPPKQALAPERLVMLSPQRYFGAQLPTVTLEQYQEWARANGAFAKMAFYRPVVMRAGGSAIRVGRVSGDLFGLLGARVPAGAELVVRDGKYAGVVLEVGGRKVRAAAVLPRSAWQLPGKIDAWLLTGEPTTGSKGFVVGELRKGGLPAPVEGGEDPVYCQKLSDVAVTSGVSFAMVVGLSCLLLPVTTRLSLGEYSGTRLRQRGFLAVKCGFVC